ncbi:related to DCR2 - dosage-dependent cell cycle regulator [Melanopsichium pennsylvanicum]|uniref:Related to DCR2 - dosage-dependent cell cycle regulator n=2 Tax=Melanopsichium pennsylvanicum TaxID=63383 RepID=A0AAJ4XQF2_9BASI|nr:related to DCR2-dosage-dependent cell cycle regulator [Melanopsichium pennsylvanicum 4]SNX86061.1 related to DCR2 - dosage-dependent cell cycle regulator [Melanopsichium pennsylvanicum]
MRHRIGKSLLITAFFSTLLTLVFYLAHDGILHNSRTIGWQAYSIVDLRPLRTSYSSSSSHSDINTGNDSASASPSSTTSGAEQYDDVFPTDTYAPTLPNPAPLTAITVHSCLPLTSCSPKTTPAEDALLGKWVQVSRSLSPAGQLGVSTKGMLSNLFGTIEQRYVFYRKSRRRDVQNVVEIKLVETGESHPSGQGWHRVKNGLRSKVVRMLSGEKGLHLYYRTVSPSQRAQQSSGLWKRDQTSLDPLTELDITYGDNPPWPTFTAVGIISGSHPSLASARVTLTSRRKPTRKPPLTPLTLKPDGTFKILQLADLHFSVSPEPCRDYNPQDPRWASRGCLAKNDTFTLIDHWLDTEKPDMVVLTGDQLNGQGTSWDVKSVLSLWTAPLIERKIPYAVILGNHDSESGQLSREEQMQIISNMPYSYASVGPSLVTGSGNYKLELRSPTADKGHVASLWFMDTGSHAEKDPWKPWTKPGYGYVHKDQITWFQQQYTSIKETLLPYKPDGATDLPQQPWKMRSEVGKKRKRDKVWDAGADQQRVMGRPPSVVFMHIPVPEAFNPVDRRPSPKVNNPTIPNPNQDELVVGDRKETATFAGAQSQPGIFDLFTTLNLEPTSSNTASHYTHTSKSTNSGVKLVVHGHMHLNSDCRRVDNVWICFGGGSSLAGYGSAKIERRARVIVLEDWASSIRTYHRISSVDKDAQDKRWDEFVLNYDT